MGASTCSPAVVPLAGLLPSVLLLPGLLLCTSQDKVLEVQPEQTLQDGGSASGGTVRLASGAELDYDWLVVSLGAAADPRGVPGVRDYARPFVTLEDAEYVAQRLAEFEARAAIGQPQASVVIVGAGYAGVELSAVVGERVRGKARVTVVTPGDEILETAPAGQREAAAQVGDAIQSAEVGSCKDLCCTCRTWGREPAQGSVLSLRLIWW